MPTLFDLRSEVLIGNRMYELDQLSKGGNAAKGMKIMETHNRMMSETKRKFTNFLLFIYLFILDCYFSSLLLHPRSNLVQMAHLPSSYLNAIFRSHSKKQPRVDELTWFDILVR
jgi:hypothetical protein